MILVQAGDIGYSHFLVPFLKPREPSLDWLFAWLNEVLDVVCYIAILIIKQVAYGCSFVLAPLLIAVKYSKKLWAAVTSNLLSKKGEEADTHFQDPTMLQVPQVNGASKTPRRAKRKTRYSEIATPYVPGHLVADETIFPPVQPRLHPAERSADDLAAFQEAMDRAQAAFYEVGSPPVIPSNHHASNGTVNVEADDPFLPAPGSDHEKRRNDERSARPVSLPRQDHLTRPESGGTEMNPHLNWDPVDGRLGSRPSSKALGKRRQVEDHNEATASFKKGSPDKVAKIGSFSASRGVNGSRTNGSRTNNGAGAARTRPAKAKLQAGSKLPTRQATRANEKAAEAIAISIDAQKAREAAILARKKRVPPSR